MYIFLILYNKLTIPIYRNKTSINSFLHRDSLESDGEGVKSIELVEIYLETCLVLLESIQERILTS